MVETKGEAEQIIAKLDAGEFPGTSCHIRYRETAERGGDSENYNYAIQQFVQKAYSLPWEKSPNCSIPHGQKVILWSSKSLTSCRFTRRELPAC